MAIETQQCPGYHKVNHRVLPISKSPDERHPIVIQEIGYDVSVRCAQCTQDGLCIAGTGLRQDDYNYNKALGINADQASQIPCFILYQKK